MAPVFGVDSGLDLCSYYLRIATVKDMKNGFALKTNPGGNMMKVWRVIIVTALITVWMTLFTTNYYGLAIAQSKSDTSGDSEKVSELSPEMVGDRANELLTRINATLESIKRSINALDGANEEDHLVLQLQIYKLRIKIMDDIHQLAGALLELEKTSPQPKLREQVENIFTRGTERLWDHIDRIRGEIDKIRARRPEAKPEERSVIENEINRYTQRLDTFYELGLDHIKTMEQLGLDIKKAQADFTKLLVDRANEISGRMELALTRIDDLEARRKETPDDAVISTLLIAAQKSLATNTTSQEVVLDIMDNLQLDTKTYRAQLVTMTKDIGSGLLDTNVAVSLMQRTLKKVTDWFVEDGPKYLVKLLIFVGILFVFRFAARIVRVGLEKALDNSNLNLSQLARRMIVSTTSNLVMLFGILVALSQLGIRLGPLLAGLGVIGFIVGFALQDSLGNFAAGVMILLYRPYDVGDLVDVGGVFGKVEKMSLVSTSLLTVDNQLFVVPNSKIWGDVIKNVTAQDIRRIDMVFGISYSDDIPKAESILEDILRSHDKILDAPEPIVRLHTLGASSVDFVVRPWVKVDDYWDVYWDVTRTVKIRFDAEGVSIPFPQRDVHVYNQNLPAGEAKQGL
jgi:small conductance mechanosensitive channel